MSRIGSGTHSRRSFWIVLTAAALVVIPAAIAWACNPQAHLTLDRTSYSPGQSMVVAGSYFNDADVISITGPGVATSASPRGGGFRVTVTAPSSPGSYTITASKSGGYRAGLPKSASFSVAAPASSRPTPAQPNSQGSQGSGPAFSEPGVARSPASSVQGGGNNTGGGGGGDSPTGGVGGGGTTTTGASGQTVFAGSAAPAQQSSFIPGAGGAAGTAAKAAVGSSGKGGARPSERAATADVWSGFAPGRTASLTSAAGAPDGGTGSQLGLGIGLLALGLLALVSGLTAAEVRRRRALAGR